MATKDNPSKPQTPIQGFIINEQGEEVPITDEMVIDAMKDIKLQSIGTHTGFTKAITEEMIKQYQDEKNK